MMKDIDFDELDRAVNSLMSNVPQGTNDDTDEEETVVAIGETIQDAHDEIQLAPPAELMVMEQLEDDGLEVKPEAEPVREPKLAQLSPTTPLPPARRGKFMDMVRPPIQEAAKPTLTARPSHHGPTLQPVTSMRPPAPAPKPLVEEGVTMTGWQIEPPTRNEPEEINHSMPAQSSDPVLPTLVPDMGPPVLPFLPDTKVEKRPLGRPVETPTEPATSETSTPVPLSLGSPDFVSGPEAATPEISLSENEDAQLPGQPLPAELGSELLSIETSTDMPSETPIVVTNKPAHPASSSLHIPGVARSATAASIPQQYKLQPKEENDDHEPVGAIYDTASYHQPLVHQAKKKPGWLWVIAIIVILILGAAGGAAVYYFGLKG